MKAHNFLQNGFVRNKSLLTTRPTVSKWKVKPEESSLEPKTSL